MTKPDFSYRLTAAGLLLINWGGREVRRVTGPKAKALAEELKAATPDEAQLLLARHTGNFKRSNERPTRG
jgi:hypothetical protein